MVGTTNDRSRLRGLGSALVAVVLAGTVAALPGPWGGTPLPAPVADAPDFEGGDPLRGARLVRQLDCVRCHTEPRSGHGINVPPSLRGAGSRCRPEWLQRYLGAPKDLRYVSESRRPRIRMPGLARGRQDLCDIAAYLTTLQDTVQIPPAALAETWENDAQLVAEGARLFDQYQCRGCHVLDGQGNQIGPALDGVGGRRPASYVLALLSAPDRVIPGTAMEDKDLWEDEAQALTAFLMTLRGSLRPATDETP